MLRVIFYLLMCLTSKTTTKINSKITEERTPKRNFQGQKSEFTSASVNNAIRERHMSVT